MGSILRSDKIPWRWTWQPTPVFLLGESHGQRSLAGYSLYGCKELDTTEHKHVTGQIDWPDLLYETLNAVRSGFWAIFKIYHRFIFFGLHVWIIGLSLSAGKTLGMTYKSSVAILQYFFGPLREHIQRRQWQPTPVLLPGKSHGQRSLVGCGPWGR